MVAVASAACFGIAVILGLAIRATGYDPPAENDDDLRFGAFAICREFVKERLKAPSTAKFRNYFQADGEVAVSDLGGDAYRVVSTVDSENSFGASLRSRFVCEVKHVSKDTWRALSIEIR